MPTPTEQRVTCKDVALTLAKNTIILSGVVAGAYYAVEYEDLLTELAKLDTTSGTTPDEAIHLAAGMLNQTAAQFCLLLENTTTPAGASRDMMLGFLNYSAQVAACTAGVALTATATSASKLTNFVAGAGAGAGYVVTAATLGTVGFLRKRFCSKSTDGNNSDNDSGSTPILSSFVLPTTPISPSTRKTEKKCVVM